MIFALGSEFFHATPVMPITATRKTTMTKINHEMLIAAGWNRMDEHPEEARPVMHALEDCSEAGGALGTTNAVADLYRQAGWPETEINDALAYILEPSHQPTKAK